MFRKYKYVYEVYTERNFTKAAEKLFISQPSLSVAIKNIERELGADLFERAGNVVVPTDIGKEYIATAERIMAEERDFWNRINDINNLRTGKIIIGGSNYLSSYVLPEIINKFTKKYPKIEIELVESHSTNLREMVNADEIDIILDSFDETENDYDKYFLASEAILLCVPADRPVNSSLAEYQIKPESIYERKINFEDIEAVPLSVFKNEDFIMLKRGNDMYDRAKSFFKINNIEPHIAYSVDQLNISYALASSGIGICFSTDTFFKYGKFNRNICLYRVDEKYCSRNLYAAHRKNKYCTKAMREFIKIAKEVLNKGAV